MLVYPPLIFRHTCILNTHHCVMTELIPDDHPFIICGIAYILYSCTYIPWFTNVLWAEFLMTHDCLAYNPYSIPMNCNPFCYYQPRPCNDLHNYTRTCMCTLLYCVITPACAYYGVLAAAVCACIMLHVAVFKYSELPVLCSHGQGRVHKTVSGTGHRSIWVASKLLFDAHSSGTFNQMRRRLSVCSPPPEAVATYQYRLRVSIN